jgi:hypothetical protein
MDVDQTEICQFIKSWPEQFVSGKEICRRAGGKWRFREDAGWALPILKRMEESGIIESDIAGRFRLIQQAAPTSANQRRLWISPTIRRILEESGKDFGVIDLDKYMDPADEGTISLLPEGQTVSFLQKNR